jgi:alpha-mannosidase
MKQSGQKPVVYIVVNNHFDLTWRRCWQRPLVFQGQQFVSYTDLEAYYLIDNIALAKQHPDYKFEIESALVLRTVLKRYPELLPELQALMKEGHFGITGGGETIVDANMIEGESLVRNYVDGLLWVEDTFGKQTRLAVRNDAFGNSAQLPQILRGCEINWATGMSYSQAQGHYWRGLDGSIILHHTLPVVSAGGSAIKYPPCEDCRGFGEVDGQPCSVCEGRGIPPQLLAILPEEFDHDSLQATGTGIVVMNPEEMLPNPTLFDWAERLRDQYEVHFALEEDALPHLQPLFDGMENPDPADVHPSLELNPNNSGCLVTRIKTKQIVRRQEQAMAALESLLVMAALKGAAYPQAEVKALQQKMYFTMFHDAITATHVDQSYDELMDIMGEIDGDMEILRKRALNKLMLSGGEESSFTFINPYGQPYSGIASLTVASEGTMKVTDAAGKALPLVATREIGGGLTELDFLVTDLAPFSPLTVRTQLSTLQEEGQTASPAEPILENSRFRVEADEHGLTRVYDRQLQRDILVSGQYRPGELILEHDEGSPWATLHPDFTRTPLSVYTRLVSVEKNETVQQLTFLVRTPWQTGFSSGAVDGIMIVRLVEGLARVDFHLSLQWSAYNHRLRVAMPVPSVGEEAPRHLYEIPYGVLERTPYEPRFDWAGANGDWPAIHWAGIEQEGVSVALFNRGTPSYRMENGQDGSEIMLLSLLRSPIIPTYLHEPQYYSMTDWDGMRDEGSHSFDFAVSAYGEPFADSPVVDEAQAYQYRLPFMGGKVNLPEMPQVQAENVRLASLKWAEKGSGVVLRLVEYRGQDGQAEIILPDWVKEAARVNLLEREATRLAVKDGKVVVALHAWEIATVKLAL